jgi:hypothetical protein
VATTSPARIDDDLYASAKLAGDVQSRSASQQVAHWARIGREIEASASISPRDIAEVLSGSRSYDTLGAKEQAVVRAEWAARMDRLREELNLAEEFAAAARGWVELDDAGRVVAGTRKPSRGRGSGARGKATANENKVGGRKVTAKRSAAKKATTRTAAARKASDRGARAARGR